MERRVLITIVLSFLVLYVYQRLVPMPKPVPAPTAGSSTTGPAATPASGPAAASPAAAASEPPPAPAARLAAAVVGEATEREIRVETRDVIALFTNRGARLKSWRLKHYLDQNREPQELVEHELVNQPLPFT